MPYIAAAGIFAGVIGIILYFLVIGGVLIWPLINLIAYLKVLILPQSVRKKYGSSVARLSNESFDIEITDQDRIHLKELQKSVTKIEIKIKNLQKKLSALGELKRNKDGSISQRSKAGKEGAELTSQIFDCERELEDYIYLADQIHNKPRIAWFKWSQRYGRYLGNRDSMIFMSFGFPTFFFLLVYFNFLGLNYPTIENIVEIYIYVVFIAPVSGIFDISIFREGAFSVLFSFEYSSNLTKVYGHLYTLKNWMILTLPMPIITFFIYKISKKLRQKQAKILEPKIVELRIS